MTKFKNKSVFGLPGPGIGLALGPIWKILSESNSHPKFTLNHECRFIVEITHINVDP
jgi:hypothetical protein